MEEDALTTPEAGRGATVPPAARAMARMPTRSIEHRAGPGPSPGPARRSPNQMKPARLIRSSRRHPPARSGPIPPGRTPLSRRAPAVLALAAALLVSAAPAQAAAPPHRTAKVVVVERAPASPVAERAVRRLGGTVGRSLPLAGGFAARVPSTALPALRLASSVAGVWSDARVAMRSGRDCLPGDAACYDALPPEAAWQRAIGLDRVPNKYRGDDRHRCHADPEPRRAPARACGPHERPRRPRPLRPRHAHGRRHRGWRRHDARG